MNPHEFVPLMGGLAAATGHKPLGIDGIEVWRRHLADIPDDVLRAAFSRACVECKAFPSVALLREYAALQQHGDTSPQADVWGRLMRAVKHLGIYGIDKAEEAIKRDAPLVWRALGGRPGWEHLCDMEQDQRTVYRAQFTKAYAELREREQRDRRLPEPLRPKINDSPVAAIPKPTPAGLKLLTDAAAGLRSVEDEQKQPAVRSVVRRTRG